MVRSTDCETFTGADEGLKTPFGALSFPKKFGLLGVDGVVGILVTGLIGTPPAPNNFFASSASAGVLGPVAAASGTKSGSLTIIYRLFYLSRSRKHHREPCTQG